MQPSNIEEAYPSSPISNEDYSILTNTPMQITDMRVATEKLHDVMINNIKKSGISSTEEVAIFLSGGVDSSLVAMCLKELGLNITAYTIGMEGVDDLKSSRDVANFLGIKHKLIKLEEEEINLIMDALSDEILLAERLAISSAILVTKLLERVEEDNIHHVFTGNSADFPMGGGMKLAGVFGYDDYWEYKLPQLKQLYVKQGHHNIYGRLGYQHKVYFHMPYESLSYMQLVKQLDMKLIFGENGEDKLVLRTLLQEANIPHTTRKRDMFQNSTGVLPFVSQKQRGW